MTRVRILLIFSLAVALGFFCYLPTHADTIDVTAKVPAPLPVQAPVITSPDDGQHFVNKSITVSGSCDAYTAYVAIFRNSVLAGSAPCIANAFSLPMSLTLGQNILMATAYNATDDAGPSSTPVTVYYDLPTETSIPPASSEFVAPTRRNLPLTPFFDFMYITADRAFIAQPVGSQWQWQLTVHEATSPYQINIDWGDSNSDTTSYDDSSFSVKHVYNQAGVYIVKIRATDKNNARAQIQLIAVSQGTQPISPHIGASKPGPAIEPIIIGSISASVLTVAAGFGLLFIFQPKAAFTAGRLLKRLLRRR